MARRRLPFVKRTRRMKGRRYMWFRFSPFNLTVREVANGILSDVVLDENDWQNPSDLVNDGVRGGARLERLILDYGFSVQAEEAFFTQAGSAQIALIPEMMCHHQSDQFGTIVTNAASWTATQNNQRIIMDNVMAGEREFTRLATAGQYIRSVQGRYETKTKVRLQDGALALDMRLFFSTADANLVGFTDWVRPTFLLSTS